MAKGRTRPGGQVVAFPTVDLPGLTVAATCGLGNHITGSRNEVWLCPGYALGGEPVMLYVKLGLSTRAMLVEALCAQLAHCIGLDTAPPYLVTVSPHHVGRARGRHVLAFGAEDVSERAMARPVRALHVLLQLLRARRLDDLATCFDEWIANDVRSPSDILVSPEQRLYMIDHEAAMAEGLRTDQAVTNWLAGQLLAGLNDPERVLFLRRLRGRLAALQRVPLAQVPLATQYSPDGVALYSALLQFLRDRLGHLDRLVSQRVMPEQAYLTESDEDEPQATRAQGDATD